MIDTLYIRWGIKRDLPQILAIETACFDDPWCQDDFLRALRQRNCISMVVERESEVIGYMVYELHEHHIRLLKFAVHPNARRHRVGTSLLAKLVYKLLSHRRERLDVTVRESNLPAMLFFRAAGLRAVAVRPGLYGGEDGYELVYRPDDDQWDQFGGCPVNRVVSHLT